MYVVANHQEYSPDERRQTYYSGDDYERFKDDTFNTLKLMDQGLYPDTDELTFRGLESRMAAFSLEKRRLVRTAINALLRQQNIEKKLDDTWIERFYTRLTHQGVVNAHRVGMYDAHVAFQLFQSKS